MPASSGVTTLSAAGAVTAQPGGNSNNRDNVGTLQVSGTYGTCVGSIQGTKDIVGTASPVWNNIDLVRMDTLSIEQTPTLTDNQVRTWKFDCTGFQQVRFNLSSIGSGSIRSQLDTGFYPANPIGTSLASSLSGNQAITGTMTITSASASSLAVGANGSTNPVFVVDDSGTTPQTGISIKGAAAASGVAVQVITTGTNEDVTIDAAAAGTVKIGTVASTALGAQIGSSTSAANASLIVQSTKTTGFVVGRLGATTPAFQVDPNTATSTTGVKVKSAASAAGVALSAIGGNGNETFTIDSIGTGKILIAGTSTGGANVRIPVGTAAATGTTIANVGTTLAEGFNYITAANNALAVQLPVGAVGMQVTVVNAVYSATLPVFPQVNSAINNLAANASYSIGNGSKRLFTYAAAGQWYSDLVAIA